MPLLDDPITVSSRRLPSWFRQELPDMEKIKAMQGRFRTSGLHTICESGRCPNMGRCWGAGVATFMILGEICTRACRFCAVACGNPQPVEPDEPRQVALAVRQMRLRYVVITSVARDDIDDEGAGHFARTIREMRACSPETKIETLVPDFSNKIASLQELIDAGPDVISHNIETVRRLSPIIRPQADYERSLDVLFNVRRLAPGMITKSSLMLGLGESREEVIETMRDVRAAGCDILTLGQYLAPSRMKRHLPVERFVTPTEFEEYRRSGEGMGFKHVMSAPLVRSSYIAEESYLFCRGGRR